jgi:hypothetical protein
MNNFVEESLKNLINDIISDIGRVYPSYEQCNPSSYFSDSELNYIIQWRLHDLDIYVNRVYDILKFTDIFDIIFDVDNGYIKDMIMQIINDLYLTISFEKYAIEYNVSYDEVANFFSESYVLHF